MSGTFNAGTCNAGTCCGQEDVGSEAMKLGFGLKAADSAILAGSFGFERRKGDL
jgi:hypothetical protein